MKYKDINWERLLDGPTPEELKEENKAFQKSWIETFGDTSKMMPPDFAARQGGGDGIYLADNTRIDIFKKVKYSVEKINAANNGIIISQPLDPSGNETYIKSSAPYYTVTDISELNNVFNLSDGLSFNSFYKGDKGSITWTVFTGKLFTKIESEEVSKRKEDIKDDLAGLFDDLYHEREEDYEPLDDASAEQIFFNDTGLDYDPGRYDINKIRNIVGIKDFFDYLTDKDYGNDEDPEAGRGGVTNIIYNTSMNAAGVRCLIDQLIIYPDSAKMSADDCRYSEILPLLGSVDIVSVSPACHTHYKSFMWLDFIVANIRK